MNYTILCSWIGKLDIVKVFILHKSNSMQTQCKQIQWNLNQNPSANVYVCVCVCLNWQDDSKICVEMQKTKKCQDTLVEE